MHSACVTDIKTLKERLYTLEMSLLLPKTRRNKNHLSEVLADDFLEFGASGRSYRKKTVIASLLKEPERQFKMKEFRIRKLAPGCALATYRLREKDLSSLRSSIWVMKDGSWQMRFHQGTLNGT